MAYADELLDGFNESLTDFGTTITPEGSSTPVPVLAVFPEASLEMQAAGFQPKGAFNFQVSRTAATTAGIALETRFTVAGNTQLMRVAGIEDDPGSPILYLSGAEDR